VEDPPSRHLLEPNEVEENPDDFIDRRPKPNLDLWLSGKRNFKTERIEFVLKQQDLIRSTIEADGKEVHFGYDEI
jgi:hypothetical protein